MNCPTGTEDPELPAKIDLPKNQKRPPTLHGFVNYYRNHIPRLSEKIAPFHKLIKAEKPIKITNEIMHTFTNINKSLGNPCPTDNKNS